MVFAVKLNAIDFQPGILVLSNSDPVEEDM